MQLSGYCEETEMKVKWKQKSKSWQVYQMNGQLLAEVQNQKNQESSVVEEYPTKQKMKIDFTNDKEIVFTLQDGSINHATLINDSSAHGVWAIRPSFISSIQLSWKSVEYTIKMKHGHYEVLNQSQKVGMINEQEAQLETEEFLFILCCLYLVRIMLKDKEWVCL